MSKKKPVRSSRRRLVADKAAPELCGVAKLGIQIGEMWLAHDGAEMLLREEPDQDKRGLGEDIVSDLYAWQHKLIDLVSYQRAQSLAGALVHVAMISDCFSTLNGCVQTQESRVELNCKIDRMMQSVTIVLRKAMGEAAFGSISEMADVYLRTGIQDKHGGPEGPLSWVDTVPKLIADERTRRHAEQAGKKGGVRAAA